MTTSRSPALALVCAAFLASPAAAQPGPAPAASALTYADLADLSVDAEAVVRARVRQAIAVPPERGGAARPGYARVYIEAETIALIAGSAPLGQSLRYLVDVPLDPKGKLPKLKKREFIVFAKPVAGRPGELRLVAPTAQLPWDAALEARLAPILAELSAPDAAPAITGVRDALSVPGTLTGESETQVFLATPGGDPVSLTIVRRPGMAPAWGVSFSEIVDQAARPPAQGTLAWYRLACFLPPQLPAGANLAQDPASRARAAQDYRLVIEQLGPCPRTRERQ
ncbi:MAG: hypothetical protein ACEQR8_00935 [Cypionkella sp.]